jgi:hypothetical protein
MTQIEIPYKDLDTYFKQEGVYDLHLSDILKSHLTFEDDPVNDRLTLTFTDLTFPQLLVSDPHIFLNRKKSRKSGETIEKYAVVFNRCTFLAPLTFQHVVEQVVFDSCIIQSFNTSSTNSAIKVTFKNKTVCENVYISGQTQHGAPSCIFDDIVIKKSLTLGSNIGFLHFKKAKMDRLNFSATSVRVLVVDSLDIHQDPYTTYRELRSYIKDDPIQSKVVYALELDAYRKQATSKPDKTLIFIHGLISNHGLSYARPLLGIALVNVLFLLLYASFIVDSFCEVWRYFFAHWHLLLDIVPLDIMHNSLTATFAESFRAVSPTLSDRLASLDQLRRLLVAALGVQLIIALSKYRFRSDT